MRRFWIALAPLLILALVMSTIACAGGGTQPATLHTPSPWTGDALVQTVYGPVQGFADQTNT